MTSVFYFVFPGGWVRLDEAFNIVSTVLRRSSVGKGCLFQRVVFIIIISRIGKKREFTQGFVEGLGSVQSQSLRRVLFFLAEGKDLDSIGREIARSHGTDKKTSF